MNRFLALCSCLLPVAIAGCQVTLQMPTGENQAKFYINAVARGQEAYYKANGEFANSIEQLNLNLMVDSPEYKYLARSYGEPTHSILIEATAKQDNLRSYAGLVYLKSTNEQVDVIINACQTTEASKSAPSLPTTPIKTTALDCPPGSEPMR